ncbi:MAG TPA: glycosyltransferase family 2 protein [Candidatus Saccharimonadales bacterium]|nr:glycosyltransferase family 2 protein [Candidatus Saccharimonadales bacterium]
MSKYHLIAIFLTLFDFLTLSVASLINPTCIDEETAFNDDFTILIPIFGDLRYLKNIKFLQNYGKRVLLCSTNQESNEFNREINQIARDFGFRIHRSSIRKTNGRVKPNPWKLFTKTLSNSRITTDARDEIIANSFVVVKTKFCIFLDGDTESNDSLYRLVGLMDEKNYDIASVRVLVAKPTTLTEKLQAIEYQFAMDARRVYPWLTSGACMVAKTKVIRDIMQHHSLFFSGGDIEVGKLAKLLHYRVGHLAFEFFTDAPSTFAAWFRQRMAWAGGGFRHSIINGYKYTWRHPFYFLYFTVVVYGLVAIRWYDAIRFYRLIPAVIVVYWILLFAFRWKNRSWLFFLFPFYALTQVMLIVPLGIYRYTVMAVQSRNIGIIRLRDKPSRKRARVRKQRTGITEMPRGNQFIPQSRATRLG